MEKYTRDDNSKAVLNSDTRALAQYKIARAQRRKMESSLDDINTLKEEMGEIKSLLKELLEARK